MPDDKEIARKFTGYLDRMLAGQEIAPDAIADGELRGALDFARKINALGATPSARFQSQLKAELLQKLTAREALKEEKPGFWKIFRSHRGWQVAVAAAFVIILASVIWRAGYFQPAAAPTTPPAPNPALTIAPTTTVPAPMRAPTNTITATTQAAPSGGALEGVMVSTDRATYLSGETVGIDLTLTNTGAAPLTLQKLPPVLSIIQAETGQSVYTFASGNKALTLAANENVTFHYGWTGKDFSGRAVIGSFYIALEGLQYNGQSVPPNAGSPARFEILPGP
jgi:hypothetical protein